jgi:transposase
MLFYFFNGRNAQRTRRHFGISRQTFYRWKRHFDRHDLGTLEARSHRPHQVRQPDECLSRTGVGTAQTVSALGQDKLAVLLRRERCWVSISMVGRILVHLKRVHL